MISAGKLWQKYSGNLDYKTLLDLVSECVIKTFSMLYHDYSTPDLFSTKNACLALPCESHPMDNIVTLQMMVHWLFLMIGFR